ncbi:DUF6286 domain-containing protein [Corynebacterium comes]|uniref:DUF6286 domain-containing protein n=1 Tax=Corynebacterium comes TaxID=2675218 RepID=A0A6B8VVL5_9CORY|nr:DUF6286 domain-containing protein [Corynebacterium comes]QGU03727.1 hypothetical protein CETAM_02235 [Corynebacterium comes]
MSADRRPPRANPWARYAAVFLGLILLAVAVVCARELWLRNSRSIHWESWVNPIVMTIGNATFQPWMLPAGLGALLLGGFLVWVAVRPRTRTHRAVASEASVWMRPVDIARMLSGAALAVPGVATAASHVSGRSATVSITTGFGDADLSPAVDATLTPLLADLGLDLNLRVRRRPLEEANR